jgi:gamma-glutamyltranspeptidase/glutathione hydrolase
MMRRLQVRRLQFPVLASGFLAALLIPVLSAAQEDAKNVLPYRDEQPVRARRGMVVSVHHLASDAGLEVLREGGNAVDAAVATGFALAVAHPAAGNLGGGGFLLLRTHDGKTTFIDFREKAPLKATETMYQDAKGQVIPDEQAKTGAPGESPSLPGWSSVVGYRSIATPGSVAGLVHAERKFGKLGLRRVLAPAIQLAADGFQLTAEEAHELSDPDLARFPDSKRIFQRDGRLYQEGETFKQPELARTLRRIAADPDDFYRGKMAHELIDDLKKGGALLTLEDLARYTVVEREPIVGQFHGYTVLSAPPPSSGGIVLLSTLNILEGYDLARLGDRTPDAMHLIAEAFRRAYMDRSDYLGDPDFNRIPVAELTSKKYADAWRSGIQAGSASPSATLLRPEGFLPPAPKNAGRRAESPDTTHYSVVDSEGNAVAVTTTLNDSFGSRVTSGSLGFLLNDEMDDFAVKLGAPNMFGLIQGPANAIAPGKRPLSSMTPTIVLENGRLRYVLGSPGGARIISTVANILLSVTEGGLNIQQAVDAPRFHHQYQPDTLYLEPGFSPEALEGLRAMGYKIDIRDGHWSNGECIAVDPKTGDLEAGQDHRSHYGKAAGY